MRSDPNQYAAWLAFNGFDRGEILGRLTEAFPDLDAQQIGKLASQAGRVRQEISAWEAGDPADRIARVDIPRLRSIPDSYRYVVNIVCEATDEDGEELIDARTMVIDSGRNLSRGNLEDQAMLTYNQLFTSTDRRTGSPRLFPDLPEPTACYMDVVSVARRT